MVQSEIFFYFSKNSSEFPDGEENGSDAKMQKIPKTVNFDVFLYAKEIYDII